MDIVSEATDLETIGNRDDLFKKGFSSHCLSISRFLFGRPSTYDRGE
jgi:hypothetical protein